MNKIIRIGTRSSELALWQANTVANKLQELGYKTEIVKIDSVGDVVLDKPLYELGITGVFTKNLDIALLNDKIDIAVNSLKDVPTKLPKGIVQAAVLERGDYQDILVLKNNGEFLQHDTATIATGSLRRKAQWLNRYPNHQVVGLRGNVNTRLKKLEDNNWDAAIFAKAGLKRINLLSEEKTYIELDWMIPAPAQGAVMVAALEKNKELLKILEQINHQETAICVNLERSFLRILEGGCTAPIGAHAILRNNILNFKGVLFSADGKIKLEYSETVSTDDEKELLSLPERAAKSILNNGGKEIMESLSKSDAKSKVLITKMLTKEQLSVLDSDIDFEMANFITIQNNKIGEDIVNQPIKNVIITSQNAVWSLFENFDVSSLNFKNIYCVGNRTKELIEKKIGTVIYKAKYGEELAKYLLNNLKDSEVTFFCSNIRQDDLPNMLQDNGINVKEVCCYNTILSTKKMDDVVDGILFFSPSAVESYVMSNRATNQVVFCIGETTANKAKQYFKNIIVSKATTIESVLQAVNTYFQK